MRDVYGLISDPLQIVVDARNREHQAQIDGHQLMQRQELNDAVIDFELEFVDGVFFFQHTLGKLLVGIQHGVDGLMDGAFRETAHP